MSYSKIKILAPIASAVLAGYAIIGCTTAKTVPPPRRRQPKPTFPRG